MCIRDRYQHAWYNSALCSTFELVRLTQTESSVLQPVQQNRKCDDVLVCIVYIVIIFIVAIRQCVEENHTNKKRYTSKYVYVCVIQLCDGDIGLSQQLEQSRTRYSEWLDPKFLIIVHLNPCRKSDLIRIILKTKIVGNATLHFYSGHRGMPRASELVSLFFQIQRLTAVQGTKKKGHIPDEDP